jgi:hypothetical protein|tara:strand:+ start:76 stop:741 length:666 start_codon:yes stop_codon:yes gene_type:complete
MGAFGGPDIVEDGLILALDAGSERSYPGSGTAWNDLSGSGNNGVLTNGPVFSSANGGSFNFDGSDDFVAIGGDLTLQVFSVCLWVNPGTSQVTYADIIDNNHTGSRSWVLQQNGNSLNNYYFYAMGTTTSNLYIPAGIWSQVILTYSSTGNERKIYLNGVDVKTATAPTITYDGTEYLNLAKWGLGGRNWNGSMSRVLMYSKALTQAEVTQNYNAQKNRFI